MADRYPDIPGAKGPDGTSQDAAEAIAPCVSYLRRVAMRALDGLGEATVLEAVAIAEVARERRAAKRPLPIKHPVPRRAEQERGCD